MDVNDLPRVDSDTILTPGDYIRQIAATLAYWLAIHTDNEAWATMWASPYGDYEEMLKHGGGVISIMDCEFDLVGALVEKWCEDHADEFWQCSECGCISENGYDPSCECEKVYDDWLEEWEDMTEEEREFEDEKVQPEEEEVSARHLLQWLEEIYYYKTWDESWVATNISEYTIEKVMLNEGFEWYRDTVSNMSHVDTCIDEVQDALRQLRDGIDQGRVEVLTAATMASHIWHVHGNIMRDYADNVGADSSKFDNIQQTGLVGEIEQEDIDLWLAGETDEDFEYELGDIIAYVEDLL